MTNKKMQKESINEIKTELEKWRLRIEQLKKDAENAKSEHRPMLLSLIKQIQDTTEIIGAQLSQMSRIESEWGILREGVLGTVENLEESYKGALSYMM